MDKSEKKGINVRCLFRDPVMSVLLVISLGLTFFLIFNGIEMVSQFSLAQEQKKKEHYKTEVKLRYVGLDEYDRSDDLAKKEKTWKDFLSLLNIDTGNVILYETGFGIGNAFGGSEVFIQLATNEENIYQLERGRFPTKEELAEQKKVVIIGIGMEKYTEQIEGKTMLRIENDYYEVIGEFSDCTGRNADGRILLYYEALTEVMKKKLYDQLEDPMNSYTLLYGTNGTEFSASWEYFYQWAVTNLNENLVPETENMDEVEREENSLATVMVQFNPYIIIILVCFSVINCIVICSLWIQRRKKEFVIRKAYGQSLFRIGLQLLGEVIKLSVVATGLMMILQLCYNAIMGQKMYWYHHIVSNFSYFILLISIVIIVILILPIRKIAKINPAIGIREL